MRFRSKVIRTFSFSPLRDSCPGIRVHRFMVLSQLSQVVKKPRKTSGTKVPTDLLSFPRSPKSLFFQTITYFTIFNSILQLKIIWPKGSMVVNRSLNRLFDWKPLLNYLTITLELPHNYPDFATRYSSKMAPEKFKFWTSLEMNFKKKTST